MLDAASESRLVQLHPLLVEKIRSLADMYQAEYPDDALEVVQGLRSWAQQAELWAKGRDGQGNVVDEAQIVTKAPPGHSWHEFGLAADCCPRLLKSKPNWDDGNPKWQRYGQMAESLGLVWGGRWHRPDLPHVQLTGLYPVSPTDETRQVFKDGGTISVWRTAIPDYQV